MSTNAADSLTLRERLDWACAELRRRLRSGEDCHAEDYLDSHPSLAELEDHAVTLIVTEFIVRQQLGQTPSPDEWLARFPRWQERLKQTIATADIERTKSVLPSTEKEAVRPPMVTFVPAPGTVFGRYELLDRLGKGGMGVVFRAWDPALSRTVALKMIRDSALATDDDVARFEREAKAEAQLQHRNVVALYDIGHYQGQHYFTMALATGGSLHQHRERFRDPRLR